MFLGDLKENRGDCLSNQIYRKGEYIIFKCGGGYIVQNTKKPFKDAHTHLNNYNACKRAIEYVIHAKIPTRVSFYYLESLARLSTDEAYSEKLRELIKTKTGKGKGYYININKGVR